MSKTAIVTGGTRGIGLACVERLCAEGVEVLFTGRNRESGAKVLANHGGSNQGLHFLSGDMSNETFCMEATETALRLFGRLDYLVNNAFPFTTRGLDASRGDWMHTMEAGPVAYATMIQDFVKLRGRENPGAIVNMCSVSGRIAQPNRWTYNAAKGAVIQLTRCAAMDLAPKVRVNAISPGWVWTDEVEKATRGQGRAAWEPIWGKYHLLRRLGEPSEIASVVAFLLSDDAAIITGADLFADGGYLAMGGEGLGETSNFAGSK